MEYRREIDGLRAFAVLPVILFHAGFNAFSGGFIGVDIFFVISGYLITTILLNGLSQGSFSIVEFYERRARRILPVLSVVMLACIPFAWMLLSPFELISFSKSIVAVPLFVSNFFFLGDGGYFETAAELKPLLHTWSLAVEEQYYLFFPVFLMVFWRFGKRFIFWSIVIVALSSLALAQITAQLNPTLNFFLLPTRAWEIAIGALVAFEFFQTKSKTIALNTKQYLAITGLALLLLSIFIFDTQTPFPSVYALLPTLGTALIILFATKDTYVGKFLGSSVFVGVGLISYSAYLWHQPVFAFVRHLIPNPNSVLKLGLIVFILMLSFITWKVVEAPFRGKKNFNRRFVFSLFAVVSFVFISFGISSSKVDFSNEDEMAKQLVMSQAIYAFNMNERLFIKSRIEHESLEPKSIVLGSSRIMQVGKKLLDEETLNFAVSAASVEDSVAIWSMALKKFQPDTFVIGVDPWLFNLKSGRNRWKSLDLEFHSALADMGIEDDVVLNKKEMNQLQNNEKGWIVKFYQSVNFSKITAEDDSPSPMDKIRRDGSRVYNESYANRSASEVERGIESYLTYAMSPYEFSTESENLFKQFVSAVSAQHNVVLVLSPYHPKLYELMRTKHRHFIEIENKFREIAAEYGVEIIGSYDPATVGCTGDEFFDGMHPKESCMAKVMNQAFTTPSAQATAP